MKKLFFLLFLTSYVNGDDFSIVECIANDSNSVDDCLESLWEFESLSEEEETMKHCITNATRKDLSIPEANSFCKKIVQKYFANNSVVDGIDTSAADIDFEDPELSAAREEIMQKYIPSPITFKDINWSMKPKQIIDTMHKHMGKEYCADIKVAYNCADFNGNTILYFPSQNTEYILFSCSIYNGCGYSIREMAEIINKQITGLSNWSTQIELFGAIGEYYCANGKMGDKICTAKIFNNPQVPTVVYLIKGSLGNNPLDF